MTADTGFRTRYATSFDRVAVVSDESWMRPAMRGLSFMLPGKARAFPVAELEAAKAGSPKATPRVGRSAYGALDGWRAGRRHHRPTAWTPPERDAPLNGCRARTAPPSCRIGKAVSGDRPVDDGCVKRSRGSN